VPSVLAGEGAEQTTIRGGFGPLNDPTAIMYVMTSDLDPVTGKLLPTAPVEPLVLRANAGDCIDVTLRNNLPADATVVDAGPDGILVDDPATLVDESADNVTSIVPNTGMPDLGGWQDMMWVVKRQIQDVVDATGAVVGREMHFFNNLVKPSALAGLHPQLVEYDMSKHDGVVVGINREETTVAAPGGIVTYKWYAGDLATETVRERRNRLDVAIVARPVEFGATNLVSADRVKQPQKGMFASLVIEPAGAVVTEDTVVPDGQGSGAMTRDTRAQVSVNAGAAGLAGENGSYREALAIAHKIANLRWADGSAIPNVNQGELGREGAEDSGHAGFNYGMEPSWFRFKLPPDVPFGNALTPNSFGAIPNQHAMYANGLVENEPNTVPNIPGVATLGDMLTPIFRTTADSANPVTDTRMFLLNGASADRDSTFILHGHLWQREPYVCTGSDVDGSLTTDGSVALPGRCAPDAEVPSAALGNNLQAKYMGGQEGMGHVFAHWPILFDAGGTDGVVGDYLFRDYAPNGNRNGMFGILRVE